MIEPAKYVLIIHGRIMASSNSVEGLKAMFDHSPGASLGYIKTYGTHYWVEGFRVQGSLRAVWHCSSCMAFRNSHGKNESYPCKNIEHHLADAEVFYLHKDHTDDVCCVEHNHHVSPDRPHVNCILR